MSVFHSTTYRNQKRCPLFFVLTVLSRQEHGRPPKMFTRCQLYVCQTNAQQHGIVTSYSCLWGLRANADPGGKRGDSPRWFQGLILRFLNDTEHLKMKLGIVDTSVKCGKKLPRTSQLHLIAMFGKNAAYTGSV